MRVRILSGNEAGQVQEVSEAQGEHMVQFGFAELAPPEPPPYVYDREAIIRAAEQAHEEREREAAERAIKEPPSSGDPTTDPDRGGPDDQHRPGVADH